MVAQCEKPLILIKEGDLAFILNIGFSMGPPIIGFNEIHSLHLSLNWASTKKMQSLIQNLSLVNWAYFMIDYPLSHFFKNKLFN